MKALVIEDLGNLLLILEEGISTTLWFAITAFRIRVR